MVDNVGEEGSSNPREEEISMHSDAEGSSKKESSRSDIWLEFEKKTVGGVLKAKCKHCGKLLSGNSSNGTSHLRNHFIRSCPARKSLIVDQEDTSNATQAEGRKNPCSFNQEIARRELARMIVVHEYPLSMVEHSGFRRYSNALQPLFKCPSRNTTKADILSAYQFEKSKMMQVVEKNESRVAITTDMWTASHQTKGYMVVTAHYIDSNWELNSLILSFAYVPTPHTKETLGNVLMECLMDWNVDNKISTITLDNCSTNDAMVRDIRTFLPCSSLLMAGRTLHMRCCAHILNLIVKDGLSVIENGIKKVRDSVSFWTATPKRLEKFLDTAKQLKIDVRKKVVLDCPTRWNSTLIMLQTALSYRSVFCRLSQRGDQYKILPTDEEWDFAFEICNKLQIFHSATKELSGTKYPTSNLCFVNICDIKLKLTKWVESDKEVIKKMAQNMKEKFDKYWDDIHVVVGDSAVLDPRFKLKVVEFYYGSIYGADAEVEVDKVKNACFELFNEYQERQRNDGGSCSSQMISSQSPDVQHVHESIHDFTAYVRREKRARNSVKTELDNYLYEDVLHWEDKFDVLSWWKTHGISYPILREMARDILAIPASTVASESAFSTGGRLINPHRNKLNPETMEPLMCLKNWFSLSDDDDSSKIFATFLEDIDAEVLESEASLL